VNQKLQRINLGNEDKKMKWEDMLIHSVIGVQLSYGVYGIHLASCLPSSSPECYRSASVGKMGSTEVMGFPKRKEDRLVRASEGVRGSHRGRNRDRKITTGMRDY